MCPIKRNTGTVSRTGSGIDLKPKSDTCKMRSTVELRPSYDVQNKSSGGEGVVGWCGVLWLERDAIPTDPGSPAMMMCDDVRVLSAVWAVFSLSCRSHTVSIPVYGLDHPSLTGT